MAILENLDLSFFKHIAILLAIMAAFTGFKIASCAPFKEGGEPFSWKKLGLGVAKHLIALAGLAIVYAVSSLLGQDLLLIQINSSEVTLQAALDIVMLAIIGQYGLKLVQDVREYFKSNDAMEIAQAANQGIADPEDVPVLVENPEDIAQG